MEFNDSIIEMINASDDIIEYVDFDSPTRDKDSIIHNVSDALVNLSGEFDLGYEVANISNDIIEPITGTSIITNEDLSNSNNSNVNCSQLDPNAAGTSSNNCSIYVVPGDIEATEVSYLLHSGDIHDSAKYEGKIKERYDHPNKYSTKKGSDNNSESLNKYLFCSE